MAEDSKGSDSGAFLTADQARRSLRDLFFAILIVIILIWPNVLSGVIDELGGAVAKHVTSVKQGDTTVTFVQQANEVDQLKMQVTNLQTLIGAAAKAPDAPASITKSLAAVNEVASKVETASRNSARILAQQTVADPAAAAALPAEGWIFCGLVDGDPPTAWMKNAPIPKTITAASPAGLDGTTVSIGDAVYLRVDKGPIPAGQNSSFRASQPITGALKEGQQVKVLRVEVSLTDNGNHSLWAQVRRVG